MKTLVSEVIPYIRPPYLNLGASSNNHFYLTQQQRT
jgi:hypothetical protein